MSRWYYFKSRPRVLWSWNLDTDRWKRNDFSKSTLPMVDVHTVQGMNRMTCAANGHDWGYEDGACRICRVEFDDGLFQ
jgi:hypothetical protein